MTLRAPTSQRSRSRRNWKSTEIGKPNTEHRTRAVTVLGWLEVASAAHAWPAAKHDDLTGAQRYCIRSCARS